MAAARAFYFVCILLVDFFNHSVATTMSSGNVGTLHYIICIFYTNEVYGIFWARGFLMSFSKSPHCSISYL